MFFRPALIAATLLFGIVSAHADTLTGSFKVTVSEGVSGGTSFDTVNGNPYSGNNSASATFTYTGPLNFNNTAANNPPSKTGDLNSAFGFSTSNITGYSGSGTVTYNGVGQVANFNNLAQFLSSSGSASGYTYGSYYTFDLGTLIAGTVLTITHDDGISIFQSGTRVGTSVSGPTSVVTDMITIPKTGDTVLRYARENGTPSILQVSSSVTPEPSSLALLGTGLLGMAGMVRRHLGSV